MNKKALVWIILVLIAVLVLLLLTSAPSGKSFSDGYAFIESAYEQQGLSIRSKQSINNAVEKLDESSISSLREVADSLSESIDSEYLPEAAAPLRTVVSINLEFLEFVEKAQQLGKRVLALDINYDDPIELCSGLGQYNGIVSEYDALFEEADDVNALVKDFKQEHYGLWEFSEIKFIDPDTKALSEKIEEAKSSYSEVEQWCREFMAEPSFG